MSKYLHVICYRCFHTPDSFWIGIYAWNHKEEPKWSYLFIWLNKHSTWCGAVTPYNTRTKRQFSHLWQLVPDDFDSDQEQWKKATNPNSADYIHLWCHIIKCMAMFLEFNDHSIFWKMWLRQWTVKLGLTISLCLTSVFVQWLSPKITPKYLQLKESTVNTILLSLA